MRSPSQQCRAIPVTSHDSASQTNLQKPLPPEAEPEAACRILLRGNVQGHGVRPAIATHATRHGVRGFVANTSGGVEIHAESPSTAALEEFSRELLQSLPPNAVVTDVESHPVTVARLCGFEIHITSPDEPVNVSVPTDLAICDRCRRELNESDGRRTRFPMITCAECGPRYSILRSLPFHRQATSMDRFPLCATCQNEFSDTQNRRYHAETTSCPDCGPALQLWISAVATGPTAKRSTRAHSVAESEGQDVAPRAGSGLQPAIHHGVDAGDAIGTTRDVILAGGVVALKGIGGYQLICDATCSDAVDRIRRIKRRPSKPLAVMVLNTDAISPPLSSAAVDALRSPANPIVILDGHSVKGVCDSVAGGMSSIGVMLPTTGVHQLIAQEVQRPLVVTSGNFDSDPIISDEQAAEDSLGSAVDFVIHHNRPIVHAIDDSVVQISGDQRRTVRCARGLAPMPISLETTQSILAIGAHQKVAVALSNGSQAVLGPLIGCMTTVASRERFADHVENLEQLYRCQPEVIAHDCHPDYFTTRWAESRDVQRVAVQHHHAHIVSGMVEHRLLDREVLGVAFDGTGYGTPGQIWGGEFLIADVTQFRRVAHFQPFSLPGGESAVREPWRVACALMTALDGTRDSFIARRFAAAQGDERTDKLLQLIASGPCLQTTSVGRLFDAAAAIVLNRQMVSFDAEAAMQLEAACDRSEQTAYTVELKRGSEAAVLSWQPLFRSLIDDVHHQIAPQQIAMRFHRGIANSVAEMAAMYPQLPVVVSGGCFLNRVLVELLSERLATHPAGLYLPRLIPPDDSGLAAGQLAVAAAICRRNGRLRGGL